MQRHSELPGAICFQLMVQREKKRRSKKKHLKFKKCQKFPFSATETAAAAAAAADDDAKV